MKIAIFSNTYKPFVGGVSRSIETFVRNFRSKGHEVRLFVPHFNGMEEPEEGVYRVHAIPRFNHTDFSLPLPFSLTVRTLFKEFDPDLVHVQHPFFLGEMGMHLGKHRNLPIVLTYHTQYERYSHYTPIDSELVKRCIVNVCTSFCNLCDLVIAPSRDMREILRTRNVQTPIEVIPTGVTLASAGERDKTWLRRRFGIGEDKRILVHVGRLGREKNLDFLFRSVAQVMTARRDIVFFIAGEGSEKDSLQRSARSLGIADRVIFHGNLAPPELADTYAGGDLFVFASKTETQGLVVLESMAVGTPVVAVDAPGVRDMVSNDMDGFLVPEDVDIYADKILTLLDSPERLATFSKACLNKAEQYSSSAMADRLLEKYAQLRELPKERLNRKIHHFTIVKGLLQEAIRTATPGHKEPFDEGGHEGSP